MRFTMITDGGPHPPDKWAEVTTDAVLELIAVKEGSSSEAAVKAREFKRNTFFPLYEIFKNHHGGVQRIERDALSSIKKHAAALEHCAKPLELHEDVPSTLEEVNAVFSKSPFAEHFAKPEVQAVLQAIIGQHSANVVHIERRYHVDRLAKKES